MVAISRRSPFASVATGRKSGADTQAPRETEHIALESGGVDVILVAT